MKRKHIITDKQTKKISEINCHLDAKKVLFNNLTEDGQMDRDYLFAIFCLLTLLVPGGLDFF